MISLPRGRALIPVGIGFYLLFLIATFPATLAVQWFLPDGMTASAISGTIWSGRAGAVSAGQFTTTETQWKVRPLALLGAKLSLDVDTQLDGGAVQTRVAVSPGGTVRLDDIAGVVPLALLAGVVPTSMLDGRMGLDIETLTLVDNWIVDATGTVDLVSLKVISPIVESLGSYELNFDGAGEENLEGVFQNIDGPLAAQGKLVLHKDRRWTLDGYVTPSGTISTQLSQALQMLGQRDAQGRYSLSFSGQL